MGGAMLGVFLIHMNRYLGGYVYDAVRSVIYHPSLASSVVLQVIVLLSLALGILVLIAAFDMPRMRLHRRIISELSSLKFIRTHDQV